MSRFAGERGQTLIVALVFVMGFSILLTAFLGFASTSLLANRQATANIRQGEAAEAGGEFAIQQIRSGAAAAFASPLPSVSTPLPTLLNGETVNVTVAQLNATTLTISGPATLTLCAGATSVTGDYRVTLADGTALPFGATWSLPGTDPSLATVDATGRLTANAATTYTLRAQLGNVGATTSVSVVTGTCP